MKRHYELKQDPSLPTSPSFSLGLVSCKRRLRIESWFNTEWGIVGAMMGNYENTHIINYQQFATISLPHMAKYFLSQNWGIGLRKR